MSKIAQYTKEITSKLNENDEKEEINQKSQNKQEEEISQIKEKQSINISKQFIEGIRNKVNEIEEINKKENKS